MTTAGYVLIFLVFAVTVGVAVRNELRARRDERTTIRSREHL